MNLDIATINIFNINRLPPSLQSPIKIGLIFQGHSDWELVKVSAKKDITDRHTLVDLHRISEEMDWAPDCRNSSLATNLYNVSVRAVTYDPANGRQFIGKWSRQTVQPNSCQSKSNLHYKLKLS